MRILHHGLGHRPAAYKDVARSFVHQPQLPSNFIPRTLKCAVVLEALKDEAFGGALTRPILDRFCARPASRCWVGAKKRAFTSNKETEGQKMDRTPLGTP